ncbi:MAG: sulfatase [Pirellulaceae bacterium]
MRHRSRLIVIFVGLLFSLGTISAAEDAKLNVLFIAADDLNCTLGCYGHPLAKTPNLDRLAERGMLFNHAYCQQAVCNPSRASLLSGRRPDTIRVWDLRTDFRAAVPDAVTLPQQFKQHGYHTQCIGKMFHNTGDLNDEPSWSVPAVFHEGRHSDEYVLPENLPGETGGKRGVLENADVPDDAYRDGKIADLAVKALHELKDRPFFLAVGFWRPHLPFLSPTQYWEQYRRGDVSFPKHPEAPRGVPQIALHDGRELRGYGGVPKEGPIPKELTRELRHGYLAGVSYLDTNVGKLLDALDREGLTDNTIVVFWSDHGFHLGEQSLWCKTSNFELDARVPLIIATPHQKTAGQQTGALVELVDLYPTLAELCSLPLPEGLEGTSMKPLLEDPWRAWKTAAFTQHPRPAYYRGKPEAMGYSMRNGRWRYTEWRTLDGAAAVAVELYDQLLDPHETVNLAGTADKKLLAELHRQLDGGWKAARPD